MEAVILTIIGLLINITLNILFHVKKHINNNETNIYSKLLFLNFIFLLIEIITVFLAFITNNLTLISILQRIYMSILVIINYFSVKYCFLICNIDLTNHKIIKHFINIFTIISIALIMILPLKVIYTSLILDGEGLSYDVAVINSLLSFSIIIISTYYLIYKSNTLVKIIPFLVLIFLYLTGFFLRTVYKELIFEGFFYSYVLFIMYHTIENPDVKMLNEVTYAKNQAEKANRIKSEFISSMSHEIRTPLNAIVGYSQMIDYSKSLKEAKENSKEIINASNTLLNMLSNVLDVAMIDTSSLELKEVKYDINDITNGVIDLFKYKIEEKNLKLKLVIDKKLNNLKGDPDKIKRILANLIDNSIKYTPKGIIILTIKGNILNNKCILNITIEDTGIGIDDKTKKNLFTNFTRKEEHMDSNISGMGLGLSITKSLVELMDGDITCESEVGKGTKFSVNIKQKVE